jgi:hypothetical protein
MKHDKPVYENGVLVRQLPAGKQDKTLTAGFKTKQFWSPDLGFSETHQVDDTTEYHQEPAIYQRLFIGDVLSYCEVMSVDNAVMLAWSQAPDGLIEEMGLTRQELVELITMHCFEPEEESGGDGLTGDSVEDALFEVKQAERKFGLSLFRK